MRVLVTLLGLLFLVGMVALAGCNGEQAPAKTAGTDTPETSGKDIKDKNGEEEGDPEEEVDDGPIPFNRLWPNDPKARELLLDPEDPKVVYSYWKNAQVGDWVRFLTHEQKIALVMVKERAENNIKVEFKHFELDGTEQLKEKSDIRPYDITKDDEIMKTSLLNNPFVVRTINRDWVIFGSDKKLVCEQRYVDPPTGDKNESLYSWDVRCGGFVKMRRGNFTYITLLDYGDAANPPKWDHLEPAKLKKFWHKHNRFTDQEYIPQDDPVEGELPEMPEDPPPADTAGKLSELEKLVGPALSEILKKKSYADAVKSLDQVKPIIENVRSYAQANNFVPALEEMEKVGAKADELRTACSAEKEEEASRALGELRELLDRLYISVNYKKELK